MSSSTTESRGRPMSEIPVSSPNGAPFKTFSQEYQYAETLQNPFPEVIFSGPENTAPSAASTSPAAIGGIDGTNESTADPDTRSSLRLGTPGSKEPEMHDNIWVEPAEAPWYKAISLRRWAAIIICTVGITGVVLAILGAMNKLSGERSDFTDPGPDSPTPGKTSADQTSSSDNTPSPAESTSATPTTFITSTTSGTAKPTNPPTTKIDCNSLSTYLTPISWVGTTVGAYKSEFASAGGMSPFACCRACQERAEGGCAGWLHNASAEFTPCTLVVVNVDQPDKGDGDEDDNAMCPRGRTAATFFQGGLGEDGSEGTAGMGPCALEEHVN
ncbi:uncharacterized protein B0H64DRAFT_80513 [Chaetomium fimeti]|uniref:Uncharacterized protein n=1 Tax=Chaetomium fimeti TaxID=1854472 RepID=A0AAE0HLC2_9PEZI|nr:hypothetical protein B0H64DRAFT_80513 [Chaetomium fimeti]